MVARDNAIRRESASKFTRSRERGGHALAAQAAAATALVVVVVSWPARSRRCPCRQSRSRSSARPGASATRHPMGIASPINGHVLLLLLLLLRLAAYDDVGTIRSRPDSTGDATRRDASGFPALGVSHAYHTCVYTRADVRVNPLEIQRRKRFHGCKGPGHSHGPAERVAHCVVVVVVVIVRRSSPSLRLCYARCYCVCVPDAVIALEITRRAYARAYPVTRRENRSLAVAAPGNTMPGGRDTE